MLQHIADLPPGVFGLRAIGPVSKEDYDLVVVPVMEQARRDGDRIRFLYHVGPEFKGFTAGAAWEDARVGLRFLRLFERCAVVTDVDWLRTATRAMGALMPCPVKVFGNAQWEDAVTWLRAPAETSLTFRMLPGRGVLLVEPHGRLTSGDFDRLTTAVDSWLESSEDALDGLVVHAREFPGWQDFGSFLRHLGFVHDHHRKIRRVALAADGTIAELTPALVDHFVRAEVRRFGYDELEPAIAWAGAEASVRKRA